MFNIFKKSKSQQIKAEIKKYKAKIKRYKDVRLAIPKCKGDIESLSRTPDHQIMAVALYTNSTMVDCYTIPLPIDVIKKLIDESDELCQKQIEGLEILIKKKTKELKDAE